jgi:DNA-binding NarL/FixJ family response regulator
MGRTIEAMRTILLVDDHAGFRRQARALLERSAFTVVGEAADGPTALAQASVLRPDIVLLDVGLPGDDGFHVARQLRARGAAAPIVVLTSSRAATAYGDRIADSAAAGFVRKDELTASTLAALVDDRP